MPSASTSGVRRPSALKASAVNASVPPSPLLSALSRTSTYLSVTTMVSDQKISDSMPYTAAWVTAPCSPVAASTASRKA